MRKMKFPLKLDIICAKSHDENGKNSRKAKGRIVIYKLTKFSITPWKKRKKENANQSSEEILHD